MHPSLRKATDVVIPAILVAIGIIITLAITRQRRRRAAARILDLTRLNAGAVYLLRVTLPNSQSTLPPHTVIVRIDDPTKGEVTFDPMSEPCAYRLQRGDAIEVGSLASFVPLGSNPYWRTYRVHGFAPATSAAS